MPRLTDRRQQLIERRGLLVPQRRWKAICKIDAELVAITKRVLDREIKLERKAKRSA